MEKKILAPEIIMIKVKAPLIASKHKPGQFVIIRMHEKGERIPLTVADCNISEGSLTIVFLKVGKTTKELDLLNEGDYILDVVGPLGNPTEIRTFGKVVCVGGGVGIAAIYPIAKALSQKNTVTTIIGARTAGLLIFEEEIKNVSNEIFSSSLYILSLFINKSKFTSWASNSGPSTHVNLVSPPTSTRHAPHIPVPSTINEFRLTAILTP